MTTKYKAARMHRALDRVLDAVASLRVAKSSDAFKETEHPRAANGQFGAGGGSASEGTGRTKKSIEKLDALPKPNAERLAKWKDDNIFGKEIPKGEKFVSPPMKFDPDFQDHKALLPNLDDPRKHYKSTRESIPMSKLIASQPAVGKGLVAQKIDRGNTYKPPDVLKYGNRYVLIDGHHTASAEMLRGNATGRIYANVYNVSQEDLLRDLIDDPDSVEPV